MHDVHRTGRANSHTGYTALCILKLYRGQYETISLEKIDVIRSNTHRITGGCNKQRNALSESRTRTHGRRSLSFLYKESTMRE